MNATPCRALALHFLFIIAFAIAACLGSFASIANSKTSIKLAQTTTGPFGGGKKPGTNGAGGKGPGPDKDRGTLIPDKDKTKNGNKGGDKDKK
jgi:hypothetical protein